VFACASRLCQCRLPRRCNSRNSAITRIRTGIKTGTGAGTFVFFERREGDHVCEAVQCRSLGLSLSSGRGLERTHTFDRSHRRTCCHQEYKRIILSLFCFNFLCYLGYYCIVDCILHSRSTADRAIGGRFSGENPYVQYSTIPHVSCISIISCFASSPKQSCNAYSSSPGSVDGPGLDHEIASMNTVTV
jgi:hypothetical protein